MKKEASLVGLGAALAANEAAFAGLKFAGKKSAPNLLDTGIKLGEKAKRMNPNTEGSLRNLLGSKQLAPYDAGQKIGIRMKYMDEPRKNRFLEKTVGMGAARAKRLEAETGKVKDPILKSLAERKEGKGTGDSAVNRFLQRNPAEIGKYGLKEKYTSNFLAAPGAFLDHRMAVRPILREYKKGTKFQSLDSKMQQQEVTKKPFNFLKEYYD